MNFLLYCKSYEGDLLRVKRLAKSIHQFNRDAIPFYVSAPEKDLEKFKLELSQFGINLVSDEAIVEANPRASLTEYRAWDGRLSQQVVKSEFWRLIECDAYLCIDSDDEFIRDFYLKDFINEDGEPYSVLMQSKDYLQLAINKGHEEIYTNFIRESAMVKDQFGRNGPDFDFGIPPVIWSSRVWRDLDQKFLKPKSMTLWDAIKIAPSELRWYGESLLHFKSISLHPIESLFRSYHYRWHIQSLKKFGETTDKLKALYLGVVWQSNWEYELDSDNKRQQKSLASRFVRSIKRLIVDITQ
jgi:hypothetical protein